MASPEHKNNKSIKESFSDIENNKEHNFQTANMEYKMKNVKKRQKPKRKNNFKNIETFNTLENEQYKEVETDKEQTAPIQSVENFDTSNSIFTKNVIEGATNLDDKTNTDNWEGHDDVKDGDVNKVDWREEGANFVEKVYDIATYVNRKLGYELTYMLSNKNPTKKDEELMRDYISTILTAIISLPVTFNWYYIMYCIPKDQLFNMSVSDFKAKSKEEGYDILKLVLFLFEFAFFFPSVLNHIIIDLIPTYTKKLFTGKVNFILLFMVVFYAIKKVSLSIKNMLIAIIKDSSSNLIINLMFATVFINFFVSLFSLDIDTMLSFISSPIFFIIKAFIRFIIVILISVPVGALLMFLYLVVYSLFAIPIYGKDSIGKTFMEVDSHTESSAPDFFTNSCEGESWFQVLLRNLMKIVGFFKKHLLLVILLMIIIRYTFVLRTELSSGEGIVPGMTFRDSFMFFNLLLFVSVGTWVYIGTMKHINEMMKTSK
jgi:hypothetical protein|uniref:Uncharacterized protein n=1 Tax=viral metagenome TaxID=1070528 RepID=A0A6C0IQ88_9ZZZZ